MSLADAAAANFDDHGWVSTPLRTDPSTGIAKIPFLDSWQQTPADREAILAQPWDRAKGIGLVLGEVSDNLAVIDFDDEGFADELFSRLRLARRDFYGVRTGRNRGHLYFREGVASSPHTYRYSWEGRTFSVELKGRGQQVASPPTPGYTLCGTTSVPTPVPTLAEAWEAIQNSMGSGLARVGGETAGAGYGRPWKEAVTEGERNNLLFVESCRLAEVGMPRDSAIETMLARVAVAYAGAMPEREVVRTVQSAYRTVGRKPRGRGGMAL